MMSWGRSAEKPWRPGAGTARLLLTPGPQASALPGFSETGLHHEPTGNQEQTIISVSNIKLGITQNKGKESENFYQKLNRLQYDRHT